MLKRFDQSGMHLTVLLLKRCQIETKNTDGKSSTAYSILIAVEALVPSELSRGVVVKHADSQHRGCQFESSMCHF